MWRPIAQSMLGPSHASDATPCQDSHAVRLVGDGAGQILIACVSDGAGSAKFSDVGSSIACQTMIESAAAFFAAGGNLELLDRADAIRWCEAARQQIHDEARKRDCEVRELASTLCAAIVAPTRSCFFQIGDGAMVLRRCGIYGVVFWPQSGEYANSTNFLTSPQFDNKLEFVSIDARCSDIALFTDGLERLALRFDNQTPHAPFFDPFFRAIRATEAYSGLNDALQTFLGSQAVCERSDDDKTLILASLIDDTTENAI